MPFEPFSVQCLTCGSRLRVTEPSLVGTIAACPRCNSMVQIDPPTQQVAVGASDVDSQAITEDSIPAMADSAGDSASESLRGFSGSDSIDEGTAVGGDAGPVPPGWQSERTARSRQIALIVAVSVSGLLAAAMLFVWFVSNWSGTPATAELESSPAQLVDPSGETVPSSEAADAVSGLDVDEDPTPGDARLATEGENVDVGAIQPTIVGVANDVPGGDQDTPGVGPDTSVPRSPQPTSVPADLLQSPTARLPGSKDVEGLGDGSTGMMELPPGLGQYNIFLAPDGPVDLRPTLDAPTDAG